jgi:hypothetical protein
MGGRGSQGGGSWVFMGDGGPRGGREWGHDLESVTDPPPGDGSCKNSNISAGARSTSISTPYLAHWLGKARYNFGGTFGWIR